MLRSHVLIRLATIVILAVAATARADYPERPVRLVVGYGAGGGTDIMARLLAKKLTEKWNQSVVVENKPGADGTLAYDLVAKAKPDGYTLAFISSDYTVGPHLYKLSYDAMKDLIPIGLAASTPDILLISNAVPVNSMQELVAYAKANPGKLNFGSAGPGSVPFLLMEQLNQATGMKMVHVPFNGTGPAMTALYSNTVDLLFSAVSSAIPAMKSGKARAIAITSKDRFPSLPDMPTVAEAANVPDYEGGPYFGLMAPAGTPPDIVQKLFADMVAALKTDEAQKTMGDLGFVLVGASPAEFRKRLEHDVARNAELLKNVDISRR